MAKKLIALVQRALDWLWKTGSEYPSLLCEPLPHSLVKAQGFGTTPAYQHLDAPLRTNCTMVFRGFHQSDRKRALRHLQLGSLA